MTYHALYHGGGIVRNGMQEQYPAAPLLQGEPLAQSAHKTPAVYSNTRLFDFSLKDMWRQAGLQQYLTRINATPVAVGDVIGAALVPQQSALWGWAWGVERAEAGVSFNLKTHFAGTALATINAAATGSGFGLLETPQWLTGNEIFDLEVTAWPAAVPTNLRFWVTPLLIVPKIGN